MTYSPTRSTRSVASYVIYTGRSFNLSGGPFLQLDVFVVSVPLFLISPRKAHLYITHNLAVDAKYQHLSRAGERCS